MSVYSNNRTQLGNYSGEEVVANESYTHQTGLLEMMIDNTKNDQAIFEAIIANDFSQATPGAAVEESAQLVQEAGNIIDSIKEFIMKCWEKIKGIFKSFLVKFSNVVMRDSKEFVKKYQKDVVGKDYSKMKFKWRTFHSDKLAGADAIGGITTAASSKLGDIKKVDNLDAIITKLDNGDELNEYLQKAAPSTTKEDFYKDYEKVVFEDEEEVTGLSDGVLRTITSYLTNEGEVTKGINKLQTETDTMFKAALKAIDAFSKEQTTASLDKDDNKAATASGMSKKANVARRVVEVMQTAANMIIKADMDLTKKMVGQSRRVYGQCAAFNPKSVKESAVLAEAFGEVAEYDFISSYEDYSK